MRIWAFLLVGVAAVAAAAFAVRHYGIDLAALSGLQTVATQEARRAPRPGWAAAGPWPRSG